MPYLQINYISPISDHIFKGVHVLVLSYVVGNNIVMYKSEIKVDNVTSTVMAYSIGKYIEVVGDVTGLLFNNYEKTFMVQFVDRRNFTTNYLDYVKKYQIDVEKFVVKRPSNFKDMLMREIDMRYRPLRENGYNNNVVVCPVDSRVRKVKNGFECRVGVSDSPRVGLCYGGQLVKVEKGQGRVVLS